MNLDRSGLQVSSACRRAAANADLIVLEGMGRALETNLYAQFSCNSLKLGMIKHPEVGVHMCLVGSWQRCCVMTWHSLVLTTQVVACI